MSPPRPQPDDRCGASSHALRSLLMSVMRSPDLADHAGLLVMFGSDAAVAERCPAVRKLFSPSPSATDGQHEQRSSPWSLPRNHHSSLAPVFARSLVSRACPCSLCICFNRPSSTCCFNASSPKTNGPNGSPIPTGERCLRCSGRTRTFTVRSRSTWIATSITPSNRSRRAWIEALYSIQGLCPTAFTT